VDGPTSALLQFCNLDGSASTNVLYPQVNSTSEAGQYVTITGTSTESYVITRNTAVPLTEHTVLVIDIFSDSAHNLKCGSIEIALIADRTYHSAVLDSNNNPVYYTSTAQAYNFSTKTIYNNEQNTFNTTTSS
jgi:uncharacterized protein YqkB